MSWFAHGQLIKNSNCSGFLLTVGGKKKQQIEVEATDREQPWGRKCVKRG